MAYTKTEGYETTRETSLETSISSGSVTSKSTRNEYSVPFNNYSAANHLIKSFIVSGVTPQAGDDPNGVYTRDDDNGDTWTDDDSGTTFTLNPGSAGGFVTTGWTMQDTDFNPYATTNSITSNFTTIGTGFINNANVYPFVSDYVYTDGAGDFAANGVISNPVGSDIE